MHKQRIRRAGWAALVATVGGLTWTMGTASAASVPTLTGLCWMGTARPTFRVHNTDSATPLQYTLTSGGASRSGDLSTGESAYFVATGRFPTASPATLQWSAGSASGQLASAATSRTYCTYDLRPQVRFVDATGAAVEAPQRAPGLVVSLNGPLERLVCTWSDGHLDCTQQTLAAAPLPPGSYRPVRSELQIPAFTVQGSPPWYEVSARAPSGYEVISGTGLTALADVGTGLGESNADARLSGFFPPGGSQSRILTVTMQLLATQAPAATEAPPTTTAKPRSPAAPASPTTTPASPTTTPARPTTTPARTTTPRATPANPRTPVTRGHAVVDPTTAATKRLPRTGPVTPVVPVLGVGLVCSGLAVIAAEHGWRRRRAPRSRATHSGPEATRQAVAVARRGAGAGMAADRRTHP